MEVIDEFENYLHPCVWGDCCNHRSNRVIFPQATGSFLSLSFPGVINAGSSWQEFMTSSGCLMHWLVAGAGISTLIIVWPKDKQSTFTIWVDPLSLSQQLLGHWECYLVSGCVHSDHTQEGYKSVSVCWVTPLIKRWQGDVTKDGVSLSFIILGLFLLLSYMLSVVCVFDKRWLR